MARNKSNRSPKSVLPQTRSYLFLVFSLLFHFNDGSYKTTAAAFVLVWVHQPLQRLSTGTGTGTACITSSTTSRMGKRTCTPSKKTHLRLHLHHSYGYSSFQDDEGADTDSGAGTNTGSYSPEDGTTILPLVIFDSPLLPNQTMHFSSNDPKFDALISHILSAQQSEIGILGLDPPTKLPLKVGVTATITKKDIVFGINNTGQRILATSFKGKRRFGIIGEPWMVHESFYLSQAKIMDDGRPELTTTKQQQEIYHLNAQIPTLVEDLLEAIIRTEFLAPAGLRLLLRETGTMPSVPRDRAMWVGALLNPALPVPLGFQEIRPALLSYCRNDHDRILLASVALKSNTKLLWKEKDTYKQ